MLNIQDIANLKLDKKHEVRFRWLQKERELSVEVWRPTWQRDGHGMGLHAHVLLSGAELETFLDALAGLREPAIRPAA